MSKLTRVIRNFHLPEPVVINNDDDDECLIISEDTDEADDEELHLDFFRLNEIFKKEVRKK